MPHGCILFLIFCSICAQIEAPSSSSGIRRIRTLTEEELKAARKPLTDEQIQERNRDALRKILIGEDPCTTMIPDHLNDGCYPAHRSCYWAKEAYKAMTKSGGRLCPFAEEMDTKCRRLTNFQERKCVIFRRGSISPKCGFLRFLGPSTHMGLDECAEHLWSELFPKDEE